MIMVMMIMTRMMIHQHMDAFLLQDYSFFRKHLQANGCIAGDDSRCIVVLSQLYCGLRLRSDSNEYEVLLCSDSADGL